MKRVFSEPPDPRLIDSMAMRFRHDFEWLTDDEKEDIRRTMRQVYEEVSGNGFYRPDELAQRTVKVTLLPFDAQYDGKCECGTAFYRETKYCPECGSKLKWD